MTEAAGRWDRVDGWLRRHPTVSDLALAAVLSAVLLPSSLPPVLATDWGPAARASTVAALVVLHAVVVVRRTHPLPAYALACAVMVTLLVPELDAGVAPAGTVPAVLLPSALVFPVLLYAVSAHTRAPWPASALAVGLVGVGLTTARLWNLSGLAGGGTTDLWFRGFVLAALVASVLAPWALGRVRRVRADYVDSLRERGAREERTRIAREVHDVVAHSLAVMVSQAEGGRMVVGTDPGRAAPVFATIADTGREALTEMRSLVGVLRDGPDPTTSRVSPQPGLADLPALVEQVRSSGTPVELHESGHPGRLGEVGELTAYRVVQEGLTNVVKHAGHGARALVRVHWEPDGLALAVEDDGEGGATTGGSHGRGLEGMRERLAVVGGHVQAGGTAGGWRLSARIPFSGGRSG